MTGNAVVAVITPLVIPSELKTLEKATSEHISEKTQRLSGYELNSDPGALLVQSPPR